MKRFLGILVLAGAWLLTSEANAQSSSTWGDFRKPNSGQTSAAASSSPSPASALGAYNARQPEGAPSRGGIIFNKRYNTYESGQGAFRVREYRKSKAAQQMQDQQERGTNPAAEEYKKRVRKLKRKYNK
ncbi:MAG: hypothetical protein LPJ89_06995 [Hymenobacteraceae bacterium]|nr:hypothetical protein [Hymenobacteraceae bacterium]MDX5396954.1 hypothetical protein [Hymenobacteraceae bacterium]MDX5443514.1 hypothetical protein [Hymenobacteraceae bacterium]MDX5513028.1 hypothetical protein [Hymenobacteraceae bacterium]